MFLSRKLLSALVIFVGLAPLVAQARHTVSRPMQQSYAAWVGWDCWVRNFGFVAKDCRPVACYSTHKGFWPRRQDCER